MYQTHKGSSIVKVPGDVPTTKGILFHTSSLAMGILFVNLSLGKSILLAILVKEKLNSLIKANFQLVEFSRQKFYYF